VPGADWEKSNVSGSFDSFGNFTLMLCAIAGNSAWYDFTAFAYESTQGTGIFVINGDLLISTKTTYFSTLKGSLFSWSGAACWCSFVAHLYNSSKSFIL
jgi:hypothetical protein